MKAAQAEKETKVWYVTKYSLTSGILKTTDEYESHTSECGKYVSIKNRKTRLHWFLAIGTDAFDNLEDAKSRFEVQRQKAIKSTEKRLKKLQTLACYVKDAE